MAKFLNTTGVSYHLEELIRQTTDRLILISPYLQFNDRVKEHLHNLNLLKKDIRIIYRENKLHPDESNWLAQQIGVRSSICKNLHAKCYINESEAIITSMNLYEFSQINNNEMGIHITKEKDPELYNDVIAEAQRLLKVSEEIIVTVQKIDANKMQTAPISLEMKDKSISSKRFYSMTALSKELSLTSKELTTIFERKQWIKKNGKEWELTSKGMGIGAQVKNGQYGEYIAWPETVIVELN